MLHKLSTVLIAALLLASCSVTRERSTAVYFASFGDYPDMWISPNTCPMQHTVLGQLTVEVLPALVGGDRHTGEGVYRRSVGPAEERIGHDELLAMAVAEARARGANGISNLAIEHGSAYRISGLLIRLE